MTGCFGHLYFARVFLGHARLGRHLDKHTLTTMLMLLLHLGIPNGISNFSICKAKLGGGHNTASVGNFVSLP